jgi:hypothetical protein
VSIASCSIERAISPVRILCRPAFSIDTSDSNPRCPLRRSSRSRSFELCRNSPPASRKLHLVSMLQNVFVSAIYEFSWWASVRPWQAGSSPPSHILTPGPSGAYTAPPMAEGRSKNILPDLIANVELCGKGSLGTDICLFHTLISD